MSSEQLESASEEEFVVPSSYESEEEQEMNSSSLTSDEEFSESNYENESSVVDNNNSLESNASFSFMEESESEANEDDSDSEGSNDSNYVIMSSESIPTIKELMKKILNISSIIKDKRYKLSSFVRVEHNDMLMTAALPSAVDVRQTSETHTEERTLKDQDIKNYLKESTNNIIREQNRSEGQTQNSLDEALRV